MSTRPSNNVPGPFIEEVPLARKFFASYGTLPGITWLVVRVLLGWAWLSAGLEKWESARSAWLSGVPVQGFAQKALDGMDAPHASTISGFFDWNRHWLEFVAGSGYVVIGPLVLVGEVAIGIALLSGTFTGIAAFLGIVLNFSFLFTGSVGVNPAFVIGSLLLILAWRVAGQYGGDRWLLPRVWYPGKKKAVVA